MVREGCNFNIFWPIDESQVPHESVDSRFSAWITNRQQARPQPFTDEQILWLERIRDRIAAADLFTKQDFESTPFTFDGGLVAARYLFGNELPALLQELNQWLRGEA